MVRVRRAKAFWSRNAPRQLGQIAAGLAFDIGPPQFDGIGNRRGRFLPGQAFAHHQAQHIGQRGFVARPRLAQPAIEQPLFQPGTPGFEATPSWPVPPIRFHPAPVRPPRRRRRLRATAGRNLLFTFFVVIGPAQGIGVARAAHQGDIAGRGDCGAARAGGLSAP